MSKMVKIAGDEYPVEGMSAFKFELVGDKLLELFQKVPGVDNEWAKYVRDYRNTNKEVIDRASAQFSVGGPITDENGHVLFNPVTGETLGRLAHLTAEDWDKADPPQHLTLRPEPGEMAEFSFYFERYYGLAKKDVLEILSLLITSNKDLEDADMEEPGHTPIPELLARHHRMLRYRASIAEMLDVIVAVGTEIKETFDARKEELGNLRGLLGRNRQAPASGPENESPSTPTPPAAPTPSQPSGPPSTPAPTTPPSIPPGPQTPPTPPASPPSQGIETQGSEVEQTSSIASPPRGGDTGGDTERSSIGTNGASSPNLVGA